MSLKKRILATVVAVAIGFSVISAQPKRAEAIIGIVTFNPAAIVVGAVLTVAGVAVAGGGWRHRPLDFVGGFLALIGLVILDDEGQPSMTYPVLNSDQAKKMNLSDTELSAYLSQREEINAVVDGIAADMTHSGNTTSEFAKSEWEAFRASLDPNAFSAVQKISTYYVNEADKVAAQY